MKPTFSGEVQFAGYSDSSRSGPRVTLRLADRSELERFVGCEGKRYMAVLVEIGNDEQPVSAAPAPAAESAAKRERMAPLCEWTVMRCGEPLFQRWAFDRAQALFGPAGIAEITKKARTPEGAAEKLAREVVVHLCGVESRNELDTNATARDSFNANVRKPFIQWSAQQEVTA